MRAGAALALLALAACGKPSGPPLVVTPAMYLDTHELVDVHDGDRISLEFPPQGGHVLFVGARAGALEASVAELRARLRSVADDTILAEEARTVAFEPSPEDPTVRIPDLSNYGNVSNVPVCPSYTAQDLYNMTFTLEVVVTATDPEQTGSARRQVIPSCLQTNAAERASCECECAANYVLGKCN